MEPALSGRRLVGETESQVFYWDLAQCIIWSDAHNVLQDEAAALLNVKVLEGIRDELGVNRLRIVVDIRGIEAISRPARAVYAGERNAKVLRATALLVDSKLTQVLANFHMKLQKPMHPHRLFKEPSEAIAWLHTFPDD